MKIHLLAAMSLTAVSAWGLPLAESYTNPVIAADYSDPDAIRVGDDYWLTASSFVNAPGMPILHSADLVNWEIVNHAVKKVPPYDFYDASPQHGKGIWAPSIRYHDGLYYIFWGDPDFGIYMITASDPAGQWSEPHLVKAGKGMIDPTPLWDDDGRLYLVHAWAGSRIGFNSVVTIIELSPDGKSVVSDPVMVFDGNDGVNHTIEGPKLYKRDGYYYIFAPAGGVEQGWQLALRSKDIYGPYEPRIVMAQGSTDINGPHQGALVDTPDGKSWFLHFQDQGLYGRVLHLNPVEWRDGWPIIGQPTAATAGEPCRSHTMPLEGTRQSRPSAISDSFSATSLSPQWEWAANYRDWFGFPTSRGFFRLNSAQMDEEMVNLWNVPNLLLQKFPGRAFTATARITFNCKSNSEGFTGGLLLFGYDYGYIGLTKEGDDFRLVEGICTESQTGTSETVTRMPVLVKAEQYEAGLYPNLKATVWLRAKVSDGGRAEFYYSLDGKKFKPAPASFQCRQGKWVGAKCGLFSTVPGASERGWLDIDEFNITDIK